ncbi:hypothetical protein EVAR_98122_1 [Eumeta japonica]|uniref:Uncharacterized protein n=1 Tax=Eumeta variegata TaxID=151549 RepID=A0A4C2A675_EUMVA|nr:hypothetical protein EVAR_98122_1 [Eumeta japonica]
MKKILRNTREVRDKSKPVCTARHAPRTPAAKFRFRYNIRLKFIGTEAGAGGVNLTECFGISEPNAKRSRAALAQQLSALLSTEILESALHRPFDVPVTVATTVGQHGISGTKSESEPEPEIKDCDRLSPAVGHLKPALTTKLLINIRTLRQIFYLLGS